MLSIRAITVVLLSGLWATSSFADERLTVEYKETEVTDADRQHWSFRPVRDVAIPPATFPHWRRNAIDDFIGRRLLEKDLSPQLAADRGTLLRRLKFDITGLPPTPEDVAAFVDGDDTRPFAELVDELLQQPGYGEHWAQQWLDLARFAETDGFEHDRTRSDAWKYRDWVIESLNADMPYDEFLRLQIAGDELQPGDPSARTATMFCLSGPDMPDINLSEERRHTLLNEMTATVGEVVLGLQVGCAQCHDHKYDPISQADFYRMRAIFEPGLQLFKNKSVNTLQEQAPYEANSHLMLRGDFSRLGPVVWPATLRVVTDPNSEFRPVELKRSSGRRTAFADWLAARENPLTARVIVNRIWQQHFGTGLVDTPSDFGFIGSQPTHPELLDWLARTFVDNGWSLKKLHRLILTSATWRQRSFLPVDATPDEKRDWQRSTAEDPGCRLLSRFPRRRLAGEVIRDAMLSVAGILNRKTGGPGIRPPLPDELVGTLLKNQWDVTKETAEHNRRSVYVFARRNLRYPIFEAFDRPSANASCSRRSVSTTAPQSLHLLNSSFSLAIAEQISQQAKAASVNRETSVREIFLRVLGRTPDSQEVDDAMSFLGASSAETHAEIHPMTHLCLALLNCNEFVFVD